MAEDKNASQIGSNDVTQWLEGKVYNAIDEVKLFISNKGADLVKYSIYPMVVYCLSKDNYNVDLSTRQFDKDTILFALSKFQYLIMRLNSYAVIAPSKELFCSFLGWSTTTYENVLKSDGELHDVIEIVDDYIIDVTMSMAQTGDIQTNIAKFRNQVAGKHGHSLVTKKEEHEVNKADYRKSRDVLEAELEKLRLQNKTS